MPRLRWFNLIHVRVALCIPCLTLLALSELYSAADLSSDSRFHLPAWVHPLGFGLFLLPIALVFGLVLLLRSDRKMLGFSFIATSVLLYAIFICGETFQSDVGLGDWISMLCWCTFCALGVGAARILMFRDAPFAAPRHSE
jgi:hypothetical protein